MTLVCRTYYNFVKKLYIDLENVSRYMFKVNVAQVPCLRTKYRLREFVAGVAGEAGGTAEAEMVQKCWLRTPLPHAPGARITVV